MDALNEDFLAALNADVESQARVDWINDARDVCHVPRIERIRVRRRPLINTDSPDLDAINADVAAQVDAQWISDANAALQQWIVVQGYGSMASASVDVRPDFDAINAGIKGRRVGGLHGHREHGN